MKLSDYIKSVMEKTPSHKVDFDVGIDVIYGEIEVVEEVTLGKMKFIPNRINFTVEKVNQNIEEK